MLTLYVQGRSGMVPVTDHEELAGIVSQFQQLYVRDAVAGGRPFYRGVMPQSDTYRGCGIDRTNPLEPVVIA
jgi:hypothetical protein